MFCKFPANYEGVDERIYSSGM